MDTNAMRGRETAQSIEAGGGRAIFVHGDVSRHDVQGAIQAAVEAFGKLDMLWSNAGIPVFKTITDTTEEEWDRIVAVNLTGAYHVARHGIPELLSAGGGTMVLTASTSSFVGGARWAAYCATKGGVLMLCKAMALDYADQNVRINCVCPGSVDTPLLEADMRSRHIPYEQALTRDAAAHPMRRAASRRRSRAPRSSCRATTPASPRVRRWW